MTTTHTILYHLFEALHMFQHIRKMCMCFSCNSCLIFCHFFSTFWTLSFSDLRCIDSGYLMIATSHTILNRSFLKLCTCFPPGLQVHIVWIWFLNFFLAVENRNRNCYWWFFKCQSYQDLWYEKIVPSSHPRGLLRMTLPASNHVICGHFYVPFQFWQGYIVLPSSVIPS